MNSLKEKLIDNKGISGVEITTAILVLMIFISLITVIFSNIYNIFSDNKRKAEATAYATQILEEIEKMYYNEITNQNLANKILEMNIPNGYNAQIQVENYNENDLIKNIIISINYNVGNSEKSIQFETIKKKEILITPNKPIIENGMVPVKYVVTNREDNAGYWILTSESDSTWYSYENKRWANAMSIDGLTVEGNIQVSEANISELTNKKIETYTERYVWLPKYAYKQADNQNEIIFLYNTTNMKVDSDGNMQDLDSAYTVNAVFDTVTGKWVSVYDNTEEEVEQTISTDTSGIKELVYSKYGNIENLIK